MGSVEYSVINGKNQRFYNRKENNSNISEKT